MSPLKLLYRLLVSLVLLVAVAGCAGGKRLESTGEYFDDVAITAKVRASILENSQLSLRQINVETFKGIVQLSGFVDSSEIAAKATEVVRTIKGVKKVNNSLVVK